MPCEACPDFHREDHDPHPRGRLENGRQCVQRGAVAQVQVEDQQCGTQRADDLKRPTQVLRLPDQLELRIRREQQAQAGADNSVVVGHDDSRASACLGHGLGPTHRRRSLDLGIPTSDRQAGVDDDVVMSSLGAGTPDRGGSRRTSRSRESGGSPDFALRPPAARLGCSGCRRTVASNRIPCAELVRLVGWRRDARGSWCVVCQWERGQTPEFASRIRSEALPQPARWVQMEAQRWDRLDKTLFWAVLLGLAALTLVIVAALLMR